MEAIALASDCLIAHKAAVEAAERLITEAKSEKTAASRVCYLTGLALYELGEYVEALDQLTTSFNLEHSSEAAARISVCLWRQGDLPNAIRWVRRAIEINPKGSISTQISKETHPFFAILGQFLLQNGEIDSAASAARTALEISPASCVAHAALAGTQMAKGDAEAAAKSYGSAIFQASSFISRRLARERGSALELLKANLDLRPVAIQMSAIARYCL